MIIHTWVTDGVISEYYPDCASSQFLIANLSGAMINTNFVLDYPRLQPTTFLNVGGIQISEKPGTLPKVSKTPLFHRFFRQLLLILGFARLPRWRRRPRGDPVHDGLHLSAGSRSGFTDSGFLRCVCSTEAEGDHEVGRVTARVQPACARERNAQAVPTSTRHSGSQKCPPVYHSLRDARCHGSNLPSGSHGGDASIYRSGIDLSTF